MSEQEYVDGKWPVIEKKGGLCPVDPLYCFKQGEHLCHNPDTGQTAFVRWVNTMNDAGTHAELIAELRKLEDSTMGGPIKRARLALEAAERRVKDAEGEEDQLHRLYDAAYQRANRAEDQLAQARKALERIEWMASNGVWNGEKHGAVLWAEACRVIGDHAREALAAMDRNEP